MTRILFVDDEVKILEGLQRMLRPQRREWEMAFAPGGSAALMMLDASPFDVIVSDMRMPEIDGAALLEIVREKYPECSPDQFCPDTRNSKLPIARSRWPINFCSSHATPRRYTRAIERPRV